MSGTHYFPLVALSFLIAICASYTALSLAGRVAVSRGRARTAWLLGGSIAMGSGIWSMHFVAMLAFHLPVAISYDVPLVALSHLVAVAASAFALWVAGRATVRTSALIGAGVCLGLAVVAMHYTGMAAVRVPAHLGYNPSLVAASIVVAVVASTVALWLFLKLRHDNSDRGRLLRATSAVVMGFAIAGMHYTAMAAAHFTPMAAHEHATEGMLLGTRGLAIPVVMGAFVILSLTLVGSITDHWIRAQLEAAAALRESEERYRAASEASAAASRAKSEFLSRMSHELRTPLNAILGFGQLMELDATTPDQQENATQVLKGGRHLLTLINEVLDITGIESGHLTMSIEPVQLGEVANEVLDLMNPLATARRVTMSHDLGGPMFVHADRQRLKQVLLNLVANAVKYNREGGVVRMYATVEPSDKLRISVTDSGPGIRSDRIARLFTPFDRLGVASQVEGTGLGLALSKRLVEAMAGAIGVDSRDGQGSTFWIELPAAASPFVAVSDISASRVAESFARTRGRILYVEDNLSNLALMQRLLARHDDIELIPAMTGGLALDLARLHEPDLILLDLHLPDLPGEAVLAQLRQDARCRDIPVVVLSADATPGQIERLTAAGVRAYLTKPLDLKPFIALLDEILTVKVAA
jgi:NO-binding membrane sensor protein with MHYT domain/nitrogen-specific signal transduction histidine kinase/ActR/RegA family two-component response regulator